MADTIYLRKVRGQFGKLAVVWLGPCCLPPPLRILVASQTACALLSLYFPISCFLYLLFSLYLLFPLYLLSSLSLYMCIYIYLSLSLSISLFLFFPSLPRWDFSLTCNQSTVISEIFTEKCAQDCVELRITTGTSLRLKSAEYLSDSHLKGIDQIRSGPEGTENGKIPTFMVDSCIITSDFS